MDRADHIDLHGLTKLLGFIVLLYYILFVGVGLDFRTDVKSAVTEVEAQAAAAAEQATGQN